MRNHIVKLTLAAILSALSVVLVMYIHVPIIPVVSFLEYDPADIPIFLLTIFAGPVYGLGMTIAVSIIQGLTVSVSSGWIGIAMHIFATGSYVIILGIITRVKKSNKRIITGISCGVAVMVFSMALWNLLITPYFMHAPVSVVIPLMPYIILFNLIKATMNGAIAYILYKATYKSFKKICKI